MKIVATRTTAFAAGIWTSVSFRAFDRWAGRLVISDALLPIAYIGAILILWIAPVTLFAVGFDRKRWDPNYVYQPGAQADFREIGMRLLFWFIGSTVSSLFLRFLI
jgi:hypothetical protein